MSDLQDCAERLNLGTINPTVEQFYADPTEDNWVAAWRAVGERLVRADDESPEARDARRNASLLAKNRQGNSAILIEDYLMLFVTSREAIDAGRS